MLSNLRALRSISFQAGWSLSWSILKLGFVIFFESIFSCSPTSLRAATSLLTTPMRPVGRFTQKSTAHIWPAIWLPIDWPAAIGIGAAGGVAIAVMTAPSLLFRARFVAIKFRLLVNY